MKILLILFSVLLISQVSKGMGYPQDMFAEHTVAKTAPKEETKTVSKATPRATKATGVKRKTVQSTQSLNVDKQPVQTPLIYTGTILSWITLKNIDLNEECVRESAIPAEELLRQLCSYQTVEELLSQLRRQIFHCFS